MKKIWKWLVSKRWWALVIPVVIIFFTKPLPFVTYHPRPAPVRYITLGDPNLGSLTWASQLRSQSLGAEYLFEFGTGGWGFSADGWCRVDVPTDQLRLHYYVAPNGQPCTGGTLKFWMGPDQANQNPETPGCAWSPWSEPALGRHIFRYARQCSSLPTEVYQGGSSCIADPYDSNWAPVTSSCPTGVDPNAVQVSINHFRGDIPDWGLITARENAPICQTEYRVCPLASSPGRVTRPGLPPL